MTATPATQGLADMNQNQRHRIRTHRHSDAKCCKNAKLAWQSLISMSRCFAKDSEDI